MVIKRAEMQKAEECRRCVFHYILHSKNDQQRTMPFWFDHVLEYWHLDSLRQRRILLMNEGNPNRHGDTGLVHAQISYEDKKKFWWELFLYLRAKIPTRTPPPPLPRPPVPLLPNGYTKFMKKLRNDSKQMPLRSLLNGGLWEPILRAAVAVEIDKVGHLKHLLQFTTTIPNRISRFNLSRLSLWFAARVAAENGDEELVLELIHLEQNHPNPATNSLVEDRELPTIYPWMYVVWRFIVSKCSSRMDTSPSTFIKNHVERNVTRPSSGWTFLHFAAVWGDTDCTEKLLNEEIFHVDAASSAEGLTPLHLAAYYGHAKVMKLLLEHNANANVQDAELKRTPLYYACANGSLAVVSELLARQEVNVDAQDAYGMMALHMAACRGNREVVREVLSKTKDPNVMTCKDLTCQRLFVGRSLRQSSTSYEDFDNSFWASFGFSLALDNRFLRPNPMELTVWSPSGFTALHFAVVYGFNSETVQEILQDKRIDVTAQDSNGLTSMDWAHVVEMQYNHQGVASAPAPVDQYSKRSQVLNFTELFIVAAHSRDTTNCSLKRTRATVYYEKVKEAAIEKMKLQWALEVGEALLGREWLEARRLISQGVEQKVKIDLDVWDHLEWVFSHVMLITSSKQQFPVASPLSKRKKLCIPQMLTHGPRVEDLLLMLVKGSAFSTSSSASTRCFRWAIKHKMVDLTEAIARGDGDSKYDFVSVRDVDLLEDFRPGAEIMEQREDVRKHLYEDRQVYMDYINTLVIVAVLVAGLAYQGWVQEPHVFSEDPNLGHMRRVFDRCNGLGFFCSMATVMVSAAGAIPTREGQIFRWHERLYRTVAVASTLLAISVACVVAAFAMGGIQQLQHNHIMIIGIVIVAIPLLRFLKRAEALAPVIGRLLGVILLLAIISRFQQRFQQRASSMPEYRGV